MIPNSRLREVALLALAGCTLSGCVAAAALPVLAGGSMLNSKAVSGERTSRSPGTPTTPTNADNRSSGDMVLLTDLTELPPPGTEDVAIGKHTQTAARSFDRFYGYALAQASLDPLQAPMRSALLENPGSLEPVRQHCGTGEPLVLIDLDPGETLFDPDDAGIPNLALAEVLAVLRARGLAVAWISDVPDTREDAVRAALGASGLDTSGVDRLLLSDNTASKQDRRQALAETACPVALAGDRRADFDELYAYLKNPDAALALNEMFGAGWFLTPNPID